MKTATVSELKKELKHLSQNELVETCLRLSKFKKENKELLTYLLFEASDESRYIENVKEELLTQFNEINTSSYYYIGKSIRKILRNVKKYTRYSKNKETEIQLLIFFCKQASLITPSIARQVALKNLYWRQVESIKKTTKTLHEDLQYDYELEIERL